MALLTYRANKKVTNQINQSTCKLQSHIFPTDHSCILIPATSAKSKTHAIQFCYNEIYFHESIQPLPNGELYWYCPLVPLMLLSGSKLSDIQNHSHY